MVISSGSIFKIVNSANFLNIVATFELGFQHRDIFAVPGIEQGTADGLERLNSDLEHAR